MQILSSECQISFLWKIYERLSEKATAYSRGCALSMLRDDDIEQIFLADTSGISILIKRQRKIEKRTKTSSSHEKKIRCAEVAVEKIVCCLFRTCLLRQNRRNGTATRLQGQIGGWPHHVASSHDLPLQEKIRETLKKIQVVN